MAVLSYCSPAFGGGTIHNQIGIIHKIQSQKLGSMGFVTESCLNFKADRYNVPKKGTIKQSMARYCIDCFYCFC